MKSSGNETAIYGKDTFSLVLPAFNEAENIEKVVRDLVENFQKNGMSFEIVVVDDGSTDDTRSVTEDLKKEISQLALVSYSPNRGIGNAVRAGLGHAKGDILGFMVSDGQIGGAEVVKVYNELVGKNLGICKGIRKKRADTFLRAFQSKAYNLLFLVLFGYVCKDVNSGPKIFRRSLYGKMELSSRDWFIDPETIIKAARLGYVIGGVPIDEKVRAGGASKIRIRTAFQFIKNMLIYRFGYDKKTKHIAMFHLAALTLSVLVGCIYVSHHFFIPNFIDADTGIYYPITLESAYEDEVRSYGGRANAAYRGDLVVGDIHTFENKDTPAWLPILNPLILGGLSKLTGSLKNGIILSDFLFPATIFLILYFLLFEMTSRRQAAILFASLFVFSPKLGVYIPPVTQLNLEHLLVGLVPFLDNDAPLYFSFFEEPKITFLFYLGAFYFLVRALKYGGRKNTVFAGVSFGLLFYTYLYDWMSFLSALGILFLFFFFKKQYAHAKQIFFITVIGFCTSVFYWINFLQVQALPQYYDIITRHSVEFSHRFRFYTVWKSYLRDIVLASGLLLVFWKKNAVLVMHLAAFLFSYFIVVNMQVVTGLNPQPDHWYRTQFLVVAVSVFLLCLWLFDRYLASSIPEKNKRGVAVFLLVYFFAGNLYSEYAYSRVHAQEFILETKTAERYDWLNKHTEKDSVVGTLSFNVAHEISVQTHNNIFVPVGDNNAASDDEIWERLMILSRVLGLSLKDFSDLVEVPQTTQTLFLHRFDNDKSFDRDFHGGAASVLPREIYHQKMLRYAQLENEIFDADTIGYRLDYVWVGPKEQALGADFGRASAHFQEVYDDSEVRIFRVAGR
ncbi:MAG: hypothetical protein A3D67_02985 [Candidatus Lloydbacteria bacterium RIFCSPHIGHO2_02_FULL_51_22]|uniref:Glycosyltransferase 2-like domain-containing protein n=2 Tax=Candidatus Lloydiibacteriota TaxID=1817910 RepID=A0A1G2DGL1_9BACT|nr:MAG: hypothetical protein A3D67_02985 [Candidatus Lloydbacteria bacterium RIFCSPHIGHO2_02_FULL_51_22]OGZ15171.1 MAG: hypothetical protein A3J08_02845 [Candidatus Lloydbacteria bacterium RIFCSPLOWO2_02_FULL_51_11]